MTPPPSTHELLQHGAFLRALARGLLGEDLADDAVQEAYLAAIRRPPGPGPLGGWLNRVTQNVALNIRRSEGRRHRRERTRAAMASEGSPDPAATAARLEIQRRLAEEVQRLQEPSRTAVLLRYYDDLTPSEIAERLGVGVRTVESRLRRARGRLRNRLDRTAGRAAWPAALLPLAGIRPGGAVAGAVTSTSSTSTVGVGAAVTGASVMSTKIVVVAVPILLAAGFFAGRELRPSAVQSDTAGSDHDAVVARLQAENERLRHRVEEIDRAPRLAGVPAAAAPLAGASAPGGPATVANEPVSMTFSLTDYDSPEDAVAHFLRYAAAMFARGEKGHLALLRTLNSFSDRKQREQFERLFGDEESAVASMYPVMRFAVEHESEVAGLTETFFKTMAEDPAFFEKADSDLVEFFGEGVALVLPAVANKEQLARMRGYVQTILALSDDELPSSLRSSRRRLMAALRAWTPSLSSEEIRARLAQGDLEPEEAQVLLERLPAEELGRLDLVALLGPRVRQGDTKALNLVRKAVARDPGRTATWDRVLLQGPPAGTDASRWSWLLRSWLGATDRLPWEKARPFMEAGIDQGGRTAEAFAMALLVLPSRPDPEWVAWMLGRADLPEGVKTLVRSRLAKK